MDFGHITLDFGHIKSGLFVLALWTLFKVYPSLSRKCRNEKATTLRLTERRSCAKLVSQRKLEFLEQTYTRKTEGPSVWGQGGEPLIQNKRYKIYSKAV